MSVEKNKQPNARELFSQYLASHRKRSTPERYAILDCALGFDSRFTVDDLHRRLEEGGFHVSLATVYNTLRLLVECNLLRRQSLGSEDGFYEVVNFNSNRLHLVCSRCGKVKTVSDRRLAELISDKRFTGFTPSYFTLSICGLCRSCQNRERKAAATKKDNINNSSSIRNRKT